ncbi:MAG: transcription antitermination factor NusB [Gammaproteobacteria bacterium]|nr:transcription antitermination factor NusB [Gammaproteobacteria bacterium]
MNPTARRNARHYALQAMYQWQISGASSRDIEAQFIAHQIVKTVDLDYFKELIHSIPEQQVALDKNIIPFLRRPIDELDPIELAILRLATYELDSRLDIPYRVIINEALELTKRFGSVEGYKFVNGVLDQIARRIRIDEVAAGDAKKK